MITSSDWRREPELITDWRRAPAATAWPREPAATAYSREAKATAWPRDLSPELPLEPTDVAVIKSDNALHVGCASSVAETLTSSSVLYPLVLAFLATVAVVCAYRRRCAARIELCDTAMRAEGTIEGKKGWYQAM